MMNMREIIDIVENHSPPCFFHGSDSILRAGLQLKPSGEPTPFYKRERFLEVMKPKDRISRLSCVYMVGDPRDVTAALGHNPRYIYEVAPSGNVEKSNLYWFDALADVDGLSDDDFEWVFEYKQYEYLRQYARNYWDGVEPQEPDVWEFRTLEASIIDEM